MIVWIAANSQKLQTLCWAAQAGCCLGRLCGAGQGWCQAWLQCSWCGCCWYRCAHCCPLLAAPHSTCTMEMDSSCRSRLPACCTLPALGCTHAWAWSWCELWHWFPCNLGISVKCPMLLLRLLLSNLSWRWHILLTAVWLNMNHLSQVPSELRPFLNMVSCICFCSESTAHGPHLIVDRTNSTIKYNETAAM